MCVEVLRDESPRFLHLLTREQIKVMFPVRLACVPHGKHNFDQVACNTGPPTTGRAIAMGRTKALVSDMPLKATCSFSHFLAPVRFRDVLS